MRVSDGQNGLALKENLMKRYSPDQIALFGQSTQRNREKLACERVMLLSELLLDILKELRPLSAKRNAVSRNWAILRTLQFVSDCRSQITELWANE